jgi:YD repeat-containing protein
LIWNDFGQLKEVRQNGTTVATYTYDGFGRRIKKVAGATTVHYWA